MHVRTGSINNKLVTKSILVTSIGFIAWKLHQKYTNIHPQHSCSNIRSHWSHEVLDEETNTDSNILMHAIDHFDGIRINSEALPTTKKDFEWKLKYSLKKWKQLQKRGIFLKLPMKFACNYLEIAIENGFIVHHARPEYIMLTQWLPQNQINMIPDYCHTYIATGCLIVNKHKQAVMIKEIWNRKLVEHWKLPGGAVDRLENIYDAAVRETKEETGLDTKFMGILQFRHCHPGRFMNTADIYFICLLKYDGNINDGQEFDVDKNEIDDIKWMAVEDVLELKNQQKIFGNEESKNNITKNVNMMVGNWDNEQALKLNTFKPVNTKINRDYYVYALQ